MTALLIPARTTGLAGISLVVITAAVQQVLLEKSVKKVSLFKEAG